VTVAGTARRRSKRPLPLAAWAGDSRSRRSVAWLARTAVLAVAIVIALAIVWLVAVPWVMSGYRELFVGR